MCRSLITFHIKRLSLAANIRSQNSTAMCVRRCSSPGQRYSNFPWLVIKRDELVKVRKMFIFDKTPKSREYFLKLKYLQCLCFSATTWKDWKYTYEKRLPASLREGVGKELRWFKLQFNQFHLKAALSKFSLSTQNWHLRHERAAVTFGLHYILVVSTLWPGDKHQERFISVTALYGICKHYV